MILFAAWMSVLIDSLNAGVSLFLPGLMFLSFNRTSFVESSIRAEAALLIPQVAAAM